MPQNAKTGKGGNNTQRGAIPSKKAITSMMNTALKQMLISGGRMGGAALGSFSGGPAGGAAGRMVGGALGAKMSKLMGSGDYTVGPDDVAVNSLFGKAPVGANASFHAPGQSVVLRHREYISDVFTGPTAGVFSITPFPVNIGLAGTFPFLAQMAQNYEEYRVKGLVFEFVSTTSPYNANSSMGSLIMAMEYNAAAEPYQSKPQMENSDYAISVRFDHSALYGVECMNNAVNNLYIRAGSSPVPITSTDLGTMYVATQPSATFPINSTLGEFWVSYDIELLRPRISNARAGYYHLVYTTPALVAGADFTSTTIPLAAIRSASYGCVSDVYMDATRSLVFPGAKQGDIFQVSFNLSGVKVGANGLSVVSNVGFAPQAVYEVPLVASFGASSTTRATRTFLFTCIGTPGIVPTLVVQTDEACAAGNLDVIINCVGNGFTTAQL